MKRRLLLTSLGTALAALSLATLVWTTSRRRNAARLERLERVHALDVAVEGVLDHGRHGLGAEGVAIAFADAGDAVVRRQLDEDEVAPAPGGRRIADDEDFEVLDFHGLESSWNGLASSRKPGRRAMKISNRT